MPVEEYFAIAALTLMIVGFLILTYAIYRGKKIVDYLKQRHPSKWEEMGEPSPGYLQSKQRIRWNEFLYSREYLEFGDSRLEEMAGRQRKLETGMIIYLVTYVLCFGGLAIWYKYF